MSSAIQELQDDARRLEVQLSDVWLENAKLRADLSALQSLHDAGTAPYTAEIERLQARNAELTAEVERLRADAEQMMDLLREAKCSRCDGSGATAHQVGEQEWVQEQCRWCYETHALIDAAIIKEAGNG